MYVRWKTLLGLGVLFWLSLCVYDAYFANLTYPYYEFDSAWLDEVAKEEILLGTNTEIKEDDIVFPQSGFYFHGITLLFWNFVTFSVTVLACSKGKNLFGRYLTKITRKTAEVDPQSEQTSEANAFTKKSGSKIPIPVNLNSSLTTLDDLRDNNLSVENSCTSLLSGSAVSLESAYKSATMKGETSFHNEQLSDQHNIRMREDILNIQERSMKETAALTRKIDMLNKEKREISRQLTIANKESRGAKQQLEELLAEKAMLIKRLESATREFKANTKSKKNVLAKLEATQETIANLRLELEKVMQEKSDLGTKYENLEKEHQNLKDRLLIMDRSVKREMTASKRENFDLLKMSKPTLQLIEPRQKVNLQEIVQSHKDVNHVQERIQNLEKFLDRLTLINSDRKGHEQNLQNSTSENSVHQATEGHASPELSKTQNEDKRKETKQKLGNLTDEQRLKPFEKLDFPGNENPLCFAEQRRLEDPFERAGSFVKSIKNSERPVVKYNFDINYTTEHAAITSENEKNTSQMEEEDSEEWENAGTEKCKMVSNSPAFQRFLKNMEPRENRHTLNTDKTHVIY